MTTANISIMSRPIRIHAGNFLFWDIVNEPPFVVWIRGSCLGKCFARGIRYEELFTGNANALPTVLPVNFRCV